jgi:glycine cleavage system H lipoate-binding protein
MLAGVVDYKLCDRNYECDRCPFDHALREQAEIGQHGAQRWPAESESEECPAECPFCAERPRRAQDASSAHERALIRCGFRIAEALFYHPAHLWARVERQGQVRVGLDDFGQWLLGRIYHVAFPDVGARVIAGHPCGEVAYQAGEVALPAPVTGVILQLNEKLTRYPSLINHDPYGEGWMLILQPERLQEDLQHLLYGEQALAWYEQEIARLHREIHSALCSLGTSPEALAGRTLQDGGVPVSLSQRGLMAPAARESLIERLGPAWWAQVIAQFVHWHAGRFRKAPERKTRYRR